MKGKVYATEIYHYLWMTMLACEQLRAYFLCHNYVPVFYHKWRLYSWLTQQFFKSMGMFHPLGTAHNFNIQFVVSLPWNTITTRITKTPVFWGYPRRPIINHTIDLYWIPSQDKTNSTLQILKNLPKVFFNFANKNTHDTPSEIAW